MPMESQSGGEEMEDTVAVVLLLVVVRVCNTYLVADFLTDRVFFTAIVHTTCVLEQP